MFMREIRRLGKDKMSKEHQHVWTSIGQYSEHHYECIVCHDELWPTRGCDVPITIDDLLREYQDKKDGIE